MILVGDRVHLGHVTPGGSGVTGTVVEIRGTEVIIEGEPQDGPFGKHAPRYKGLIKNAACVER